MGRILHRNPKKHIIGLFSSVHFFKSSPKDGECVNYSGFVTLGWIPARSGWGFAAEAAQSGS